MKLPRKIAPACEIFSASRSALSRGDVQVLRGDLVGQRAGLVGIAGEDHRAELFQALPGQLAPLQAGQLPAQLGHRAVQRRLVPADQDARAGACSAWAIRSAAVYSGRVERSTITTTSLGPAIESMSTSP